MLQKLARHAFCCGFAQIGACADLLMPKGTCTLHNHSTHTGGATTTLANAPQGLQHALIMVVASAPLRSVPDLIGLGTSLRHQGLKMACLQAQACLAVLAEDPRVKAELDAIAGMLQLRKFGVELLPLQFAQVGHMHSPASCMLSLQSSSCTQPCSDFFQHDEDLGSQHPCWWSTDRPSPRLTCMTDCIGISRLCLAEHVAAQIEDRMEVIQAALDAMPEAYADAAGLAKLAKLVGEEGAPHRPCMQSHLGPCWTHNRRVMNLYKSL